MPIEDIQILKFHQIDQNLIDRWNVLRRSNPVFSSPFFNFQFYQASAEIGREIEFAVAYEHGEIAGILPFERKATNCARPVSCQMNDAHGIIGRDFSSDEITKITAAADILSFDFHSWFGSTDGISKFAFAPVYCSGARLGDREGEFREKLQKSSYTIKQQIRKTRKLVRDHGPITYEHHCGEEEVLDTLMQWKSLQYKRQNTFDLFSLDWTRDLVRNLHKVRSPGGLQGTMSVLRCQGKPIAIHFGLQEGKTLHYWFPVFCWDFRQHSPGTELFLQVADHLEGQTEVRCIDMGYGSQPYKTKLINQTYYSHQGKIIESGISWNIEKTKHQSRQLIKNMPLKTTLRKYLRPVFPNMGSSLYD